MSPNLDDQPEPLKLYILDLSSRWKTKRLYERFVILKRFYRWMDAQGHALDSLTVEQLNEYTKILLAKRLAAAGRRKLLLAMDQHLAWAYENGHCGVNPADIPSPVVKPKNPNLNVTLPKIAEAFLASLVTHKKPSTCKGHKTSVRHLHHFIATTGLELETFGAREMSLFHEYLTARGNTAVVRCTRMVETRIYLRWLYDQQLLINDPDVTLRRIPLPRIPEALPRPLSPEADRLFEEAFLASTDIPTRGFYVMRHTGIRIGELRQMPFDCIRNDLQNQPLLKVPLGKLDRERMVPLAPMTLDLIREIQAYAQSRTVGPGPPKALFVGRHGRPVNQHSFHSAFNAVKHRLILDDKIIETAAEPITPHRLRHTYATTLLTGGISIVVLQRLLGHRSVRMTMRYAAVVPTKITEDYFAALKVLENHSYLEAAREISPRTSLGYRKLIADLVFLLTKQGERASRAKGKRIAAIIVKAEQLSRDIAKL